MQKQSQLSYKAVDRTGKQKNVSYRLDLEYVELRDAIVASDFYQGQAKVNKIRLKGWVQLMDAIIVNPVWKKNRNNFAKLLDLMCECEVILQPFTQLPPKTGLPNISKHQINAIIDRVQLAVKASTNKLNLNQREFNRTMNQTIETPKQHWNKVRQLKNNQSRQSLEESSAFMRRFMDIVEKSNEVSQIQPKERESDKKEKLTEDKENQSTKCLTTDKKKPQLEAAKTENKNSTKTEAKASLIKIKVVEHNPPSYFPKNMRLKTNFSDNETTDPPHLYRDQHQSIEVTNETLNTNSFEQYLDYDVSQISQGSCTQRSEYNFSDQLSERCPAKEVHVQEYFNKQKMPPNIKTDKVQIRQISLVAHKLGQPLISSGPTPQPEESVARGSIACTNIQLESVIDQRDIPSSQEPKDMRRFYWQSNSLSYDLQCREENDNLQINQEYESDRGIIGEEGITNILRESTQIKMN